MKNYFKLISFLKGHRPLFSMAVVLMFISSLFESVQLSLLAPMTDRIFNKKPIVVPNELPPFLSQYVDYFNNIEPEKLFWIFPFIVLVLMVLKNIFSYCYQYFMNDVSQRVLKDVRQRLYAKIESFSLDYFSEKRTGELISRITNDVSIVENSVSYGLTDLFRQSFLIVFYVTIALSIHWKAAIIVFCIGPFLAIPITQIGRKLRKLAQRSQERMADISSLLIETISGIKVVKAFCTEQEEIKRFDAKNYDFYKIKMKSVKRTLLIGPITEIFGLICGVGMIFWIGRQVMDGEISFGIFILFFGSIMSIISPVKKLGNVNAITQQALAANKRIYAILDVEPTVKEAPQAKDLAIIKGEIRMEDLSFSYDGSQNYVLKDINLEIPVGSLVAIVGPTGTGKSTLVNLIPRFYDPQKGKVLFDGVDIRQVSFPSLRLQIGIVAQETFLFNETIKANISYGKKEASDEQIQTAAKQAYAHDFIMQLPQKYDTIVGDRGFRLSGGEKQRVTIARAILKNPPILILDEATSQLDSESEKYVQDALDKLMVGRTVIAIAHRLSTIKKAAKTVVLDKGQIIGLGTHENLLKNCDLYKRLYETQFQM